MFNSLLLSGILLVSTNTNNDIFDGKWITDIHIIHPQGSIIMKYQNKKNNHYNIIT